MYILIYYFSEIDLCRDDTLEGNIFEGMEAQQPNIIGSRLVVFISKT